MAESVHNLINAYLEDTIAAERNFEHALSSFGKAGSQEPVQALFSSFSEKARTQHQRLTALLERRGGSPSEAKTLLAQMLAFSPLSAQIGQGAAEKNTQHLVIVFAAAAAEMAMYESLAAAATVSGDTDVVVLARTLQKEEREDYDQVWALLNQSALASFRTETSESETPQSRIATYITDAIAAEKSFETQLQSFAKESDGVVASLFEQHSVETKDQYDRLTTRLAALGASTSTVKGFLAQMFGVAPKLAQIGHSSSEKLTQNLMMAYAVENAEVAMYEALATVADSVQDLETFRLAKAIQKQESETAEKIWNQIAPAAERAVAATSREV